MPQVNRSALVMFSAEQMYDLVNDIVAYPEFVPDCAAAKILEQNENEVTASLQISKGGLSKWFTTKNSMLSDNRVQMELVDGPFKKLTGGWQFSVLDDNACKITLSLDFEFSSKLIEMAFGKIFNEVANNMVAAFTSRAKQVYGVTL